MPESAAHAKIEPVCDLRQRELREALDDLQTLVRRRLDLGELVATHALTWMIAAAAVGFWLGRR